jgi:hypothetical protein
MPVGECDGELDDSEVEAERAQVFSIWKQYPFEAEETAPIPSSASRRNALNPAVVS